jgi:hypothetical protein
MEKPTCRLATAADSEFSMIYRIRDALRDAGFNDRADEFLERAKRCGSRADLLTLAREYVAVE